jgi:hypothetical protein
MRRWVLVVAFLLNQLAGAQSEVFQGGEWFKFKMSYSGWLKAGDATLSVKETMFNNKPVYHIVGKGVTTGAIKWFFKVEDLYESYVDQVSGLPYKFIRKIDEGGYTKDVEINFDHQKLEAKLTDKETGKTNTSKIAPKTQDLISAYYYLRNYYDGIDPKDNMEVNIPLFFDNEREEFRLRYLGEETIETEFGTVKTYKFRPLVKADRVFRAEESITIWVSADKNRIPLRVKADLRVGSVRADLVAFKGLKHSFEVVF